MKIGSTLGLDNRFILVGLAEGLPLEIKKLALTNFSETITDWENWYLGLLNTSSLGRTISTKVSKKQAHWTNPNLDSCGLKHEILITDKMFPLDDGIIDSLINHTKTNHTCRTNWEITKLIFNFTYIKPYIKFALTCHQHPAMFTLILVI